MVIPKINSAHGSDTRNIINRAIDLINAQGKSIQELVAKGQLTPDQYAELIREVNGLIQKGNISLNDLSPEILEAINNGEGTPFNILSIPRDNSVTPQKTTFIETSTNLAVIKNAMHNTTINESGEPEAVDGNSTILNNFIPVEGGAQYTFKNVITAYNYDINFNFIQSLNVYSQDVAKTVTMAEQSFYTKLKVMPELENIQMNKGSVLLPYEEAYTRLADIDVGQNIKAGSIGEEKISKGAVTPEKTSFIDISRNMINSEALEFGYTIDATTGERVSSNSNSVSEFIPVSPQTEYTATAARWAFYDIEYNFIKSVVGNAVSPTTMMMPKDTAFVIIVVHQNVNEPMMNEGNSLLPYEPYHKPRLADFIEQGGGGSGGVERSTKYFDKFTIAGKLEGFYVQPPLPKRGGGSSAQSMNENYDNYVNSHPHYVSREKIAESVAGQPIYLYDFNPDIVNKEALVSDPAITKFPTIFIVCGTHGTERMSPLVTNHFFNQLVNNWQENELLETLRWGVRFKVIPMLNPDGWDSSTRQNADGVDLNRQFPTGWASGTPGTSTYGGTAPLTEPEAIAVNEILENEEDLIYFCDFHNFSSGGDNFIWNAGGTVLNNNLAKSHISQMMRNWKIRLEWMPQDETTMMGYSSWTPNGSMAAHAAELGIQSSTYEVSMGIPGDPTGESYSENVMTLGTEAFTNWILLNIKNNIDLQI